MPLTTLLMCLISVTGLPDDPPSGDAVIRAEAGPSEIVITTTGRVAGAIHSLTWGGKEFLDSLDHGRQLQSAANFDCGGRFVPEVFNPTEAGSRADHTGPRSSSRLVRLAADGPELRTTTRMAFWLAPGETSEGHPACNDRVLSDHLVSKRVRIGHGGDPHVIEYEVTFTVPEGERHTFAQFEAVTGYMPPEFGRFWKYDATAGTLRPLDDGPGEQASPVVLATPSGSHAMGVYSPGPSPGYGRFRFKAEHVNKWNCVFRIRDEDGIKPGDYRYRTYVLVGTLDDVRRALGRLLNESPRPGSRKGAKVPRPGPARDWIVVKRRSTGRSSMGAPPDLRDRFHGGLLGCAVGDALGAPFEGYWDHQLPGRAALLRGFFEVEGYPRGQYTDDTQLTLATIESIVRRGDLEPAAVARSIASLWKHDSVIGPGGACTRAATTFLMTRDWTTCGAPVGQAGNGTAMRTAALGLFFLRDPGRLPAAVADISRITHRDPRSVAGGIAIARAAHLLANVEDPEAVGFCAEVAAAMRPYEATFADLVEALPARLEEDRESALHAIAWAGSPRPEFSRPVITPFVIPTVLAALWSVLRNPDSWAGAVTEAIGLGGDVDTLRAIVGALAGVRLGAAAIPAHLASGVLGADRIKLLASQYHEVVTARRITPES